MNPKRRPSSQKRSRWRIFGRVLLINIKWFSFAGVLGVLFAGGLISGYVAALVHDEPVRSRQLIYEKVNENALTSFVFFNDQVTPVGRMRMEEDRQLVDLKDVPQSIVDALISTEDSQFYEHRGVDLKGTARAVKQKLLNENRQTGGSTLTQQVARRVFLSLDKTDSRKVKEMLLALRMERFMGKDKILTAYLNKMPFGNGSAGYNLYGIKSASLGIFNVSDLHKLHIAQAAYLAGLPQLPSVYSAFDGKGNFDEEGFNKAMERQRVVLGRMLATGKLTLSEYNEALQFDVKATLAPHREKSYNTFPYLMLETEREAAQLLALQQNPDITPAEISKPEHAELLQNTREELQRSGYRIYTTINKKIYNNMRQIAANPQNFSSYSKKKGLEQIAAIMIDHKTGAILGMIEGRDFNTEQMNYATQMTRQPGSAMKPIAAYLPALEKGYTQPAGLIDDSQIILKDGRKGYHIPKNYNRRYEGLMTAREALNRSINIPALRLFLYEVKISNAWNFVRSLGITTIQSQDEHAQTGVLGGLSKGVSVEELTAAYGTIPNMGVYNAPHLISKITDANGKIVYEFKPQTRRVYSQQTAFLMTDMLKTVISDPRGTGKRLQNAFKSYGAIDIAGKTGTTQNFGDVWFMGYTSDVTLGVWAGYRQQVNTLSQEGHSRAQSVWALIMNEAVKDQPELFKNKHFIQPEGVVRVTVSSLTGKLPGRYSRQSGQLVTDWFNQKYVPTEVGREQIPRSARPVVPSKPDIKEKAVPEVEVPAIDQEKIPPEETDPAVPDADTEVDMPDENNDVPSTDTSQPSVENEQETPSESESQSETPKNQSDEVTYPEIISDQPKN
ncbi:transglycosylase domain-containing protein [Paenibacillus polymyxa]|uniref:transglycosylase domain-containing protein n=1 Tax=Paenibacillus polymyxa TaxID=1406 RepID=UPI0004D872E1|nr:transglycosylase domain-containing protein [Paenibacillus polymyxa]KEO79224.1 carboxypeptidase [Paenibacillus polymyxa]MCH6187218.1 transglycosylase domain-containing protein [Paenibacillus polymyxa]WRL58999.1 transglycosylase domain-containing protein [Paenibacillus polymyxa]